MKLWDIHTHILPGTDDGSDCMETTLSMVHSMYENGVRGIFATPHAEDFLRNPERTMDIYRAVKAHLANAYPDLDLRFGSELSCDSGKVEDVLRQLNTTELLRMNGTRNILLEFYPGLFPEDIYTCAGRFVEAGWLPILAHVERYRYLAGWEEIVCRLRSLGCKMQLNIYSLEQNGPPAVRDWSRLLIRNQHIDYLATDCHNPWLRPPSICAGMEYLREHCPADYLRKITWDNARADLA